MKPAIVTFSATSAQLASDLAAAIGGDIRRCGLDGESAAVLLPRLFAAGTPIVGICAAGILIRLLAQRVADKHKEPPVIAVSQDGGHVIPLLGGHHGGNALARQIAEALGGTAVLTTASDAKFAHGLDEPPEGYVLADPAAAKPAMIAMLAGAKIALDGNAPWIAEAGYPLSSMGQVKVLVTPEAQTLKRGLVYHPRVLVAGVGCERGVAADEVIGLIADTLAVGNLSPRSLAAIASVDLKADETALHEAARHYGVPLRLFTGEELAKERYRLTQPPSKIVEAETGSPSVAEAAALKAGLMAVPKHKSKRATCAIGKASKPLDALTLGRAPGTLHVVGIGPGAAQQRTGASIAALEASTEWVGYKLYLELIADLQSGQGLHRFELGEEIERARYALELAATGRTVALISSGDSQIYAMAALVYELLASTGPELSDAARRVLVEVHPGISALQAASAAAGALIGHDFCTVSLSDLLTPHEVVLQRLEAAARGDFVTALYNPRSQRRTDLLDAAKALFLLHRPGNTPVVVASNLGRREERVLVTTLFDLDPKTIDMLTIVVIGASTSRAYPRGDGRTIAFTPRGYALKGGGK